MTRTKIWKDAQTYYLKVWHQNNNDKDTAGTGAYTVSAILDNEAPSIPAGLDAVVADTTIAVLEPIN